MQKNLKLTLSYDGTDFHGWQFQPNCDTVEGQVKKACEIIFGQPITLHSCSRTDAGVHANMFCCNFKTTSNVPEEKALRGINALVSDSISAYKIEEMPDDFHARYSCKGKEYIYKIWNEKQRNPFYNKYALHFPYYLDENELNLQAKQIIGTHDFSCFCASGNTTLSNVRTVYDCAVSRNGGLVTISVKGDGFLYNMVRIICGTLLYISNGKIPKDSLKDIIESKDRLRAGITVKPQGLYLNKVYYDEREIFLG